MDELLKIKEFSKIANVSIRTLQYYDEINLLKPAYISDSGHRFYSQGSFEELYAINSLKAIGFKLKEIKRFLTEPDFNLEYFIQKEKAKTLSDISKLQGKYLALNSIEFYEGRPFIQDISSHLKGEEIPEFNETNALFLEWNQFIDNLNQATKSYPLIENEVNSSIYNFWVNNVLNKTNHNQLSVEDIEDFYSRMNTHMNTYGLTKENYQTLNDILTIYNK